MNKPCSVEFSEEFESGKLVSQVLWESFSIRLISTDLRPNSIDMVLQGYIVKPWGLGLALNSGPEFSN